MGTTKHDFIVDLDPGPRLFSHEIPQPLLSVLDHIAPILGNIEVG